jgi:hypothetical protein
LSARPAFSSTAFFAVTMDEPERSTAVILTGLSKALSSAMVSSPVPHPASKIFALRDNGIG